MLKVELAMVFIALCGRYGAEGERIYLKLINYLKD